MIMLTTFVSFLATLAWLSVCVHINDKINRRHMLDSKVKMAIFPGCIIVFIIAFIVNSYFFGF